MTIDPHVTPQAIRDAAKHGQLVIFVGAGASRLCGSPDWRQFSDAVVSQIEAERVINHLEAEQLRGLSDPRRTLSVAKNIAKASNVEIKYDSILHPHRPPHSTGQELYRLLKEMRPVFVTTNYDKWLDDPTPEELKIEPPQNGATGTNPPPPRRSPCYKPEHLTTDRLTERGSVIHLHGSYLEPDSMIISLRDYIKHYADPRVQTFLRHMFKNYVVLFVGYSMAEMEVLEYVIRQDEFAASPSVEPRHFILWPWLSSEAKQTKFMESFFANDCHVTAIPYCRDERGWVALVDVFNAWQPQLEVREPSLLDLQLRIDQYIAEGHNQSNRIAAIQLLLKQPQLGPYLFNKLRDPAWFHDLKYAGLLTPTDLPDTEVVDQPNGSKAYRAQDWPPLRYLDEIARSSPDAIPDELASLIIEATSAAKRKNIDNWRIWWSLSSILARLPVTSIRTEHIDCIRHWLTSRFDSSMVCHELSKQLVPRLLQSDETEHATFALNLFDALTELRESEVRT